MVTVPVSKGTIGVLTSETGRFSRFWASLLALDAPQGTITDIRMGLNISQNRNNVLQNMVGDWVWFVDDDQTFEPNILMRLLAHNVDIVQPLVLTRFSPFAPVMLKGRKEDGTYGRVPLTDDLSGLLSVDAVGASGMLIRKHVIDAIPFPWFEHSANKIDEDVRFCYKAQQAGFKLYTDLDTTMGHMNVGDVTPVRMNGQWKTKLSFGREDFIFSPARKQ